MYIVRCGYIPGSRIYSHSVCFNISVVYYSYLHSVVKILSWSTCLRLLNEGPEGVKWELGLAGFWPGKMGLKPCSWTGIWPLGMGDGEGGGMSRIKNGNGIRPNFSMKRYCMYFHSAITNNQLPDTQLKKTKGQSIHNIQLIATLS